MTDGSAKVSAPRGDQAAVDLAALAPAYDQERIYVASQWQLAWWRFRKHRMAMLSVVLLFFLYLTAVFCEFVAPHDPNAFNQTYIYAPPHRLHFRDENGLRLRPFVYGFTRERDPETFRMRFAPDPTVRYSLHLFVRGAPYELWGLIPTNLHLFGIDAEEEPFFLLGADRMGRDVFSRIVYGARVSLSIGLVGVFMSMTLGVLLGGASGYFGGTVDMAIQRVIELLIAIPSIPLWMGLSAALPPDWPPLYVYFGITIILSLIGWSGLARVVRGKFMSLRQEDFVTAAKLCGASELRIIVQHLVPSFLSHLIASLTLSIPGMILGETSLSFLGIGLRPPVISWGVLLQEAQNFRSVALAPWLLIPGAFVVLAVLTFNFVGDGLRDAADPYAR